MKNTFTLFLFAIVFCGVSTAQSPPQGISYQAVARDADGIVLSNANLNVRIGILANSMNGELRWEEIHSSNTNQYGLFSLTIGEGTSTGEGSSPAFANIDWGSSTHFYSVEIDSGDGIYEMMGTSQFLSVPYALHANTVENADDADADPTNESITSVELTNDIMTIAESGQSFEVDLSEYSDDGDWLLTDDDVTNTTHNIGVGTDNPTSTLSVEGSISHNVNYISITDDVIMPLGDGDHTVIVELDGGNMEIILPNPSNCPGREYIIKAFADSGVNTVNISCNTHDIDGYDSIDLSGTFRESAHLISAGDNGWWIIN